LPCNEITWTGNMLKQRRHIAPAVPEPPPAGSWSKFGPLNVRLKCVALFVAGTIIALIVPAHTQEACCFNPIQKRKFVAPNGNCGPRWEAIPIPLNECRSGTDQLSPPQASGLPYCTEITTSNIVPSRGGVCPPGFRPTSEAEKQKMDIIDAVPTFCLDRTAGIAFRVNTPRCPPGTDGISEWDYKTWPTKR
jgi:hypothetical protein